MDFLVAEMHSLFLEAEPQLFTDYPLLKQHVDMVMNADLSTLRAIPWLQ